MKRGPALEGRQSSCQPLPSAKRLWSVAGRCRARGSCVALLTPEQCPQELKAQPSPDIAADPWGGLSPSPGAEQPQCALDRVLRALWSSKHSPQSAHRTDSTLTKGLQTCLDGITAQSKLGL